MRCSLELSSLRACLDLPQRHAMARAALAVLRGGVTPGGGGGGAKPGDGAAQPASPSARTGKPTSAALQCALAKHAVCFSMRPRRDAVVATACLQCFQHTSTPNTGTI